MSCEVVLALLGSVVIARNSSRDQEDELLEEVEEEELTTDLSDLGCTSRSTECQRVRSAALEVSALVRHFVGRLGSSYV